MVPTRTLRYVTLTLCFEELQHATSLTIPSTCFFLWIYKFGCELVPTPYPFSERSMILCHFHLFWREDWPGSPVGIATDYGLGWSGDRIPVGGEIFRTCSDRYWGPPSLLYNGYRVFPGVKSGRGVTLTPYPLLVLWSRKSRAIPLLLIWAVRPLQSLSACTRVHFTFFFTWEEHLPHSVPTCSQSADATAAMFLHSNQQAFTLTCIRKLRTLRGLAVPVLSTAIAESPLARIYSHV